MVNSSAKSPRFKGISLIKATWLKRGVEFREGRDWAFCSPRTPMESAWDSEAGKREHWCACPPGAALRRRANSPHSVTMSSRLLDSGQTRLRTPSTTLYGCLPLPPQMQTPYAKNPRKVFPHTGSSSAGFSLQVGEISSLNPKRREQTELNKAIQGKKSILWALITNNRYKPFYLLTNLIKFQDVTVNSQRRKELFNLQGKCTCVLLLQRPDTAMKCGQSSRDAQTCPSGMRASDHVFSCSRSTFPE